MSQYFPPAPPKPQWVTIIAIVSAIWGVFGFFSALCVISGGIFGGAVLGGLGVPGVGVAMGFVSVLFGLLALVSGALYLAFAYGAWYLKPWAWMLGVAAQILAIISALVSWANYGSFGSFLLSVVIAGAILYFLFTPEVKRVFGQK